MPSRRCETGTQHFMLCVLLSLTTNNADRGQLPSLQCVWSQWLLLKQIINTRDWGRISTYLSCPILAQKCPELYSWLKTSSSFSHWLVYWRLFSQFTLRNSTSVKVFLKRCRSIEPNTFLLILLLLLHLADFSLLPGINHCVFIYSWMVLRNDVPYEPCCRQASIAVCSQAMCWRSRVIRRSRRGQVACMAHAPSVAPTLQEPYATVLTKGASHSSLCRSIKVDLPQPYCSERLK